MSSNGIPPMDGPGVLRMVTAVDVERNSIHCRRLLAQLAEFRGDTRLSDVTLVAEGTRFNAHRSVLAACSNYFKAMFTSDMVENRSREIEIVDMEASTLEALTNFCYSGLTTITDDNVLSILPAACRLQFNEVQDLCCDFLKKKLDPSNCLAIRTIADTYSCQNLLKWTDMFIVRNFQEVNGKEEFNQLPVEQLVDLISHEDLNVRSEEQVYIAVARWVRFNLPDRKQFLAKLMELVRLPLCQPKFLVSTVSKDTLVMTDVTCRNLLDEAKNYQLLQLSTHERPVVQGTRTRPRKSLIKVEGLTAHVVFFHEMTEQYKFSQSIGMKKYSAHSVYLQFCTIPEGEQ